MKRRQAERLPQASYDPSRCLECGRPVRKTFSSLDVPDLMKFLGGQLGIEQLAVIVRRALGSEGCFLAPKSGVVICDRKEQNP